MPEKTLVQSVVETTPAEERLPYVKPEIILEQELETRAGSPLSIDPLNPSGE